MSIELVMPSNHLILCCPLLLMPSIFPSIRVFSNESVLHIRWPKHLSFSFRISPSNENPGLTSFRMDWLDLLAVQGTLKSLPPTRQFKILQCSAFFSGRTLCGRRGFTVLRVPTHSMAAAAKSLQSCLTLCDPIDGSP